MSKVLIIVLFLLSFAVPVKGVEIQPPSVPDSGTEFMPEDTASLESGFRQILLRAAGNLRPDLKEAAEVCVGVIAAGLLVSVLQSFCKNTAAALAGAAAVASLLLHRTNAMVGLATQMVLDISEYGKLLIPVMTAAMAAQGGITTSAALSVGTALFNGVLTSVLGTWLVPGIWLYLALSIANSATGEESLKKMADFLKNAMVWILKTLLMGFTTYLGLTGVVSGSTDAATLKAAKVTISSVIPVVGGVLSDASEAVLVSTGLLKNAAGIYGIFAVLAVFLGPFLKIGCHYLILKLTAAVCALFSCKSITSLVGEFSSALGLLLGITGAQCMMMLISTVCFLRSVG